MKSMLDKKVQEVLDMLKKYDKNTVAQDTFSCLHYACSECKGTGIKKNGTVCIHMLSCSCRRCTPIY